MHILFACLLSYIGHSNIRLWLSFDAQDSDLHYVFTGVGLAGSSKSLRFITGSLCGLHKQTQLITLSKATDGILMQPLL